MNDGLGLVGTRLTEAQLRELVDALPHLVWTCLASGPCDYLSPQWVQYTGIPEADQLGYGWLSQLHPDDRERVKMEWAATVGNGVAFDIEFRIRRVDGVHRWFRTRAIPLRDSSGTLVKWYGSNADVDDYKQAQAALSASEASLAATLESIGDAMIATDSSGRVVRMNQVATHLTAWPCSEAVGRPLAEVFHIISEDTRQVVESPVERVLREGSVVGLVRHTALLAKDGVERPIADSAAPIRDRSGNVTGVVLVFHDMTAERAIERTLRQSEQRFRRLFESGVLGIIVADLVGNIRDANQAFLSMVGYTSDDLRAGRVRWKDMTPLKWQARDAEAVEELGTTGVLRSYEKEYFRKDGSVVPILLGAAMIEGSDECICYVLDVTERMRAEQALHALNAELEQRVEQRTEQLRELNRELEAFSYSVAHDLRAPLRGIAGFAQVLADDYADKFDAEGQDCLAEIRNGASRMAQLIDALLSLARVNRTDLHPVKVDLGVLVREVAGALGNLDPRPSLEWVVSDDLEVEIDPVLARTLVENLVGNAWKFTRGVASPRIEVGSTRERGAIVVFVRDNGAGFDMKYVDKLFTPFQRLHTSTEFPGTGIGLANIQRIIKRHGGKVWAEGAVGMGATFFVELPDQGSKP